MTHKEIASIVQEIIAVVAVEHGLIDSGDGISLATKLHDDLGMDEIDIMEVLFRAEKHFGNNLPDEIEASSRVSDIVDRVAERVGEREASLVPAHAPDLVPELAALKLLPTSVCVQELSLRDPAAADPQERAGCLSFKPPAEVVRYHLRRGSAGER